MSVNRLGIAVAGIVGFWLAACTQLPETGPATDGFQVAALGDSYASGQGAPNDYWWWQIWKPHWDDKRCYRSRWAPTTQAVQRLNAQGHAIEYHSFACSGAEIEEGLIGEYEGRSPEVGDSPLMAQVDALAALWSDPGRIKAVTISVGGNDAGFGLVVVVCSFSATDCSIIIGNAVDDALDALPARLDALAEQLENKVKIEPHRILIVGYPDPTRGSDGTFCHRKPFGDLLAGIDRDEAKWAAEHVLPTLNHRLCRAAGKHGWIYVAPEEEFETHGWCANPNWINTLTQSFAAQGWYPGMVHPNRDGYKATSERLQDRIDALLGGETPVSDPCINEPEP
jgi:lysophospholipase L1-like esterase